MKAVVTGAGGMLGRRMCLGLARSGWETVGLCRSGTDLDCRCRQVDLKDDRTLRVILTDECPDLVVHAAAMTDVDACERSPDLAFRENVGVTSAIADWAADARCRLLYISTDAVYAESHVPRREDSPVGPCNVYGRTKLGGEQEAVRRTGGHVLIARVNFVGWSVGRKTQLASWILNRLVQGQPLTGFSDVYFSPMAVDSLVRTLIELIESGAEGIFNVGSRSGCSKFEFARALAERAGQDVRLVRPGSIDDTAQVAPRPKNTVLSVEKAEQWLQRKLPVWEDSIVELLCDRSDDNTSESSVSALKP